MSTDLQKSTGAITIRDRLTSPQLLTELAKAVPEHVKADFVARVAQTALIKTPKLAECTQESFFSALLTCAAIGLAPDGRHAHLIPYGNQATLIVDYKGLVALVRRSGEVKAIHADTVCENDTFDWNLGDVLEHRVDWRKPRGKAYAFYAIATMNDGTKQSTVMTRDEIEAIRKRSRSGNSGPWVTDYEEMAKKTVFRRLTKWLPISSELVTRALETDEAEMKPARVEVSEPEFAALPEFTSEAPTRLDNVSPVAAVLGGIADGNVSDEDFAKWLKTQKKADLLTPEIARELLADDAKGLKRIVAMYGRAGK